MATGSRTAGSSTASDELASVLDAVRTNCHISDARHAGSYTMCIYLLKMREYFRWEYGIPYGASLPHNELTDWLTERESHWESLAGTPYRSVPVGRRMHNPFDTAEINRSLIRQGYVYSSGYGRSMKPVFFLGELERHDRQDGYSLLVSGRELARDLAAPPAMSRDGTIFIRRESLRRLVWEKLEEWRWNEPDNAMKRAIGYFDFDDDQDAALEALTDTALEGVILHEIGEIRAGEILGPDWQAMLGMLGPSKAEIMLRVVRDHLADALSTLPGLLREQDPAVLHFYMANFTGMRRELFPALVAAYEIWNVTGSTRELEDAVERAQSHWQSLALRQVELYRANQPDLPTTLVRDMEANTL